MAHKLVACLLNISEAKNSQVVEKVANAAVSISNRNVHVNPHNTKSNQSSRFELDMKHTFKINTSVLNIFKDIDYNRSVITIVSDSDGIGDSVVAACKTAYELIDLSKHEGGHPRLGSVDLVPLHPISKDTSLEELGKIAHNIAEKLSKDVEGSSMFLFGTADPARRDLVSRRKMVNWFKKTESFDNSIYDMGQPPTARYGLTGIGAIPYMMNVNVTIDTDDVVLGREVARRIRARTINGLPGVQSMAFPHEGKIEVACNVDLLPSSHETIQKDIMKSSMDGKYWYIPSEVLIKRVEEESKKNIIGSIIVGFTPEQAESLAIYAFKNGIPDMWRYRDNNKHM